jgi:RNA polymerase sigma-70 factor (ECF subfamily)
MRILGSSSGLVARLDKTASILLESLPLIPLTGWAANSSSTQKAGGSVAIGLKEPELLAAFRRAEGRLRSCARRYTTCAADEDDILQETLTTAWIHRAEFTGSGTPDGWLYRICQSCCRVYSKAPTFTALIDSSPVAFAASADDVDAAQRADERDDNRLSMVLALPKQRRLIVLLRYACDLSTNQIATGLGLAAGTVRATLFKAREQMRALDQTRSGETPRSPPSPDSTDNV